MKLVTLLFALAVVPSGQTGISTAGSWTAQFEGTTFIRLELNTAGGGIIGRISLGNFEVDERGAVRRVDPAPPAIKPISDIVQRGQTLLFSLKEGNEPDRFEFRLVESGRAELVLVLSDEDREDLAASGLPAPQPIWLTKQ